jgi:hypothetical protein
MPDDKIKKNIQATQYSRKYYYEETKMFGDI